MFALRLAGLLIGACLIAGVIGLAYVQGRPMAGGDAGAIAAIGVAIERFMKAVAPAPPPSSTPAGHHTACSAARRRQR